MRIRQTVLEKSHYRCQKCSVKFTPSIIPNFEHVNGTLKDNRPDNLRALCADCFKEVEKKENKKSLLNNIQGKFKGLKGNK